MDRSTVTKTKVRPKTNQSRDQNKLKLKFLDNWTWPILGQNLCQKRNITYLITLIKYPMLLKVKMKFY